MAYPYVDRVTEPYSAEAAKELLLFQGSQIHATKHVAEEEKLDCDAVLARTF